MKHIVIGEIDNTKNYNSTTNFVFVINNCFYLITYHNMALCKYENMNIRDIENRE